MKLAFVVQRYGTDVVGGAEYVTRKVAEHLSNFHEIEVLTTCARDYISWKNEFEEGKEEINGVTVRRFKNSSLREMRKLIEIQEKVFYGDYHTIDDEMLWVKEQGPYSPALISYIKNHKRNYDAFVFFTLRYFPTLCGLPLVPKKSILVPFAEDEPALNLFISKYILSLAGGIAFSSPEEKDLIEEKQGKLTKINDTIGCGIELESTKFGAEFILEKFSLHGKFILYLGRVEESKGCRTLFDYLKKYVDETGSKCKLVLAGTKHMSIPNNPSVKFIGTISELEKAILLKSADLLIMPSHLESLSLVTLEAMLTGTPVLVNGSCDVLKGHCLRSNGGLWYENYDEFKECLDLLLSNKKLREKLGENGKKYVEKNYSWKIVGKKYLKLFEKLQKQG